MTHEEALALRRHAIADARAALAALLAADGEGTAARSVRSLGALPRVAIAPGRVNLIGEHTDYNDGLVLPMAIDRHVAVAFSPRGDDVIRAHAAAFDETRESRLAELTPGGFGWFAYVAGVAWAMHEAGLAVCGADLAVAGDVPIGAGLSSSAALEVAVARALCDTAGVPWDPMSMAQLCQRAENVYVGVSCGLMDQVAAAAAQDGCALLLDCRSLACDPVPLSRRVRVVVMDTGVRRTLTDGPYNMRRTECQAALERLRALFPGQATSLHALRDVTPAMLARWGEALAAGDETLHRRARHVVDETARPPAMAAALRAGDLEKAGQLMNASHASLRDLYGVCCAELDAVCDDARAHAACYGARMTGAGFGGCAVALVDEAGAADFIATVTAAGRARGGNVPVLFACRPDPGAHVATARASGRKEAARRSGDRQPSNRRSA